MFILSGSDLMQGTSPKVGDGCCIPGANEFDSVQRDLRTRVESALEVQTLARRECRDTFEIGSDRPTRRRLRLANGFVTSTPLQFVDKEGVILEREVYVVDRLHGIVDVELGKGFHQLIYVSGFEADTYKVFVGLPDFIKSIAIAAFLHYQRALGLKTTKDISHSGLSQSARLELQNRIYTWYMRPRADVIYPSVSDNREVGSTGDWNQW